MTPLSYRTARTTPFPPNTDPPLLGKFGMSEMEQAARVILDKARLRESWNISVSLGDFAPDKQDGFLNLLLHQWLCPNIQNHSAHGEFFLTEEFVKRVTE